jgi:hypothetical protein
VVSSRAAKAVELDVWPAYPLDVCACGVVPPVGLKQQTLGIRPSLLHQLVLMDHVRDEGHVHQLKKHRERKAAERSSVSRYEGGRRREGARSMSRKRWGKGGDGRCRYL